MGEGTWSPEQGRQPAYRSEVVEYQGRHLAMRFKGDLGAKIDFEQSPENYNPIHPGRQGIVTACSEKNYYITHDHEGVIYVVDIDKTKKAGKLVSAYSQKEKAQIPPIEFGKPWDVPGLGK